MSARRRLAGLLWLGTCSGCEFVAGLRGERGVSPFASAGAPEAQGGLAEPACANDDGECAGRATSGGAGEQGGEVMAGAGGVTASEAGASTAGEAGAALSEQAGDTGDGGFAGQINELPLTTPSCTGALATSCGSVDPCTTLRVPGGTFEMGRSQSGAIADYFATGASDEQPEHTVTLSPYLLDTHEVTVGRFRRFVEAYTGAPPAADAGTQPKIPGSGWEKDWNPLLPTSQAELRKRLAADILNDNADLKTWTDSASTSECRPINGIDWYLAFAFCIWDQGRLPSEAQWEFAASGGDRERLFPWGKKAPDKLAVFACNYFGEPSCTAGDLPNVGSKSPAGDGFFGHADLAGSLSEPTRDAYLANFYTSPQATGTDIVNIAFYGGNQQITLRGGNYHSPGTDIRGVVRQTWAVVDRSSLVGVRCARDR